jgi:tetratricopeptide (TPR) repeat protein/CHAT domain-containing protein
MNPSARSDTRCPWFSPFLNFTFRIIVILCFLLLSACTSFSHHDVRLEKNDTPAQKVEKGDQFLLNSDFKAAGDAYSQAVTADSQYVEAYAHRCYLRTFMMMYEDALADCQQAISLAPQEPQGYIYLTRAYDWNGEYEKAAQAGEKAIVLAPQDGLAHSFLGEAYLDLGRLDEAGLELQLSIKLSPTIAETHRNLALYYGTKGKYEDQLSEIKKAIKIAPDFARYKQEAGSAYFNNQQLDKALNMYQQALAIYQKVGDRANESETLLNIGEVFFNKRDGYRAMYYYQEALKIARADGDRKTEGVSLYKIGSLLFIQAHNTEALAYYQQALIIQRELGDRGGESDTLYFMGVQYRDLGQNAEALEYFQQSLAIRREMGDRNGVSVAEGAIGGIYLSLGRYTEALDYFQQALAIAWEIGEPANEQRLLTSIGVVYASQGQYAKALEYYQLALVREREINDISAEATTLENIGIAYSIRGQYIEALDSFEQARVIQIKLGDRIHESHILTSIGVVYRSQGRYTDALKNYQEALELQRRVNDREGQGTTLNNIGAVFDSQGRYAEAMESYEEALAIAQELSNREDEGVILNNIGEVYANQGRSAEAMEHYQQALKILQGGSNMANHSNILTNIGKVYAGQGKFTEALEQYQQALKIQREVGIRAQEGATLNSIGSVYRAQGHYTMALESYKEALVITREIGNRTLESLILNNIGGLDEVQGRSTDATLEQFQQALKIAQKVGDRENEGESLNNIGKVYASLGQNAKALEYFEQARDVFENLRAVAGSEIARASYIAEHATLYNRMVELYYRQNQKEKAFLTSERGRARSFLDAMATGYVELNDHEAAALFTQEKEAYAAREAAQFALSKAKLQNPQDAQQITNLSAQLDQAKKDYEVALSAITARGDQLARLVPGRNNVLSLSQAQALLDDQTTLLSFWVLEKQTLVFILTRNTFNTISLPVSSADLFAQIEAFRSFANTDTTHPESAISLYHTIIEPLKPYLTTPRLTIVPHGNLHYLPFAALTDGSHYLIDDYILNYLPSVSSWKFIQPNSGQAETIPLILGNPITNNATLKPLPFAEGEAKSIAGLYHTKALLGKNASEGAVRAQAEQAGVLHLAAHGIYNPINPLYSALYLAPDDKNDGLLETHEIYGLKLGNTDLVVLSACETQLGQLSTGDELVGMTRAFFFAGVPSVMASLWSVDDRATQFLMEKFYTHWHAGMGKAQALQQAQIEMRAEYPNPYYWAGFVLNGDGDGDGDGEKMTETKAKNFADKSKLVIASALTQHLLLVGILIGGGIALIMIRYAKRRQN